MEALQNADVNGSGMLSRGVVRNVVKDTLPELNAKQLNAVMSLTAPDPNAGDDEVAYQEIVAHAFRCLQGVASLSVF